MSGALRKGWCPGALRPMMAKDGLLVRLRITGGIVPATTALALADLAERHGSGLFDLSARGNLQMRGVATEALPELHEGLRALALLDDDPAGEAVRNVIASPLAGLHDGLDIGPIVEALEARLAADTALHVLPTKFGFLIDDGGVPSLSGIAADVRLDWIGEREIFSIGLGGTRSDATRIGGCSPGDLVEHATRIATGALSLMARRPDLRRMRALIDDLSAASVADACGAAALLPPLDRTDPQKDTTVGLHDVGRQKLVGLGTPFGRLDSAMLRKAAAIAASALRAEIRLTPWRILLLPLDPTTTIEPALIEGFIIDPCDPRLTVAACVGDDGCARGTTRTRDDAIALADVVASLPGSIRLHVSGCEKGCAKPSVSPVTLVGRGGRYDFVRDGQASDAPSLQGLDLGQARAAIVALLEPV